MDQTARFAYSAFGPSSLMKTLLIYESANGCTSVLSFRRNPAGWMVRSSKQERGWALSFRETNKVRLVAVATVLAAYCVAAVYLIKFLCKWR